MSHEPEITPADLRERIFNLSCFGGFNELALEVYSFQYENCMVYREFADALSRKPATVHQPEDIPFMPVEVFRSRPVICSGMKPLRSFQSSGTTGSVPGLHLLANPGIYKESLLKGFSLAYGDPSEYTFLALTPNQEENEGSSLIYMISELMQQSPGRQHGFFLNDFIGLRDRLIQLTSASGKIILIGLTYALLDFAETWPGTYPGLMIVETGGMKGRRKEITRYELHDRLKTAFPLAEIHSEYGMTEMLSQAWSKQGGLFRSPPWMKIMIREVNDPLSFCQPGRSGGICIADLANIYSCSFLASQDLGKVYDDGSFEVLGRYDSSDLRGCSLMIQE
ncbi:MAG: acyl transferase [Bacteroidetes bacterium]|nr:acyl transferase [Bacteroidota bacterium]